MKSEKSIVLALDIGGTKVSVGRVDSAGQIQHLYKESLVSQKGPAAFLNQILSVISQQLAEAPEISAIGVAAAGPLDPFKGQIIEPTNIGDHSDDWKHVSVVEFLKSKIERPIVMENDAACAIQGEAWVGAAQNLKNAMILTLGTGVGVGAILDGRLLRLRSGFHPEISHIPLNFSDSQAPCGCGNFGCVEAYLSGRNFTRIAAANFGVPASTGEELLELAFSGDSKSLKAFSQYSEWMAQALHAYAVSYAPEVVIFSGGFAASFPLFIAKTTDRLQELLKSRRQGLDFVPELKLSNLDTQAGLLGAAKAALIFPHRF